MSRLVDKSYVDGNSGPMYTSTNHTLRQILKREHNIKIYSIVWAIGQWEKYKQENKFKQMNPGTYRGSCTGAIVADPTKTFIIV